MIQQWDVIVIGAGPGGLAAATSARKNGAKKVLIIERESVVGGVLNQCIHDGFGLIRYKKQLSGPEYAALAKLEAIESGVEIRTGLMVVNITQTHEIQAIGPNGIEFFSAKAIVLATGCRERTRGAIMTPGSRPAGVFTAGVAQNLINIRNIMVGKKIVIVGSGDIGLIMARRLYLEGAKVLCVVELLTEPCGLARNISQCLYDYNIPLYLGYIVTNIIGKRRVEGVEISAVDKDKQIIPNTNKKIECDTVIFSVGLIPENEIALSAGVMLNGSNGIKTDEYLQSNISGVFSCGNCRSVMDLADFVSEQGTVAGKNAAFFIQQKKLEQWQNKTNIIFKKGLPEKNSFTCSFCPRGCQINIKDGDINGNKCKRGKLFVEQEMKDPKRILTTTVKVLSGSTPLVGVRSNRPISLSNVMNIINILKTKQVTAPIHFGEVLFANCAGVDFIAENEVSVKNE